MTNPNARLTAAKGREQLAALKASREQLRCCCCSEPASRLILRGAARYPVCEQDGPQQLLACLELGGTFQVVAL